MRNRIIDRIEGFKLSAPQANSRYWEFQTLDSLWLGLEHLYQAVKRLEASGLVKLVPFGPLIHDDGTPKKAGDTPLPLIVCWFHWYAISVCSYVGGVGRLARDAGLTTLNPHEYVNRVIPAVKLWRNKIAAHLAIIDPRCEDQGAMESLCVANHLSSQEGVIQVAGLTVEEEGVGEARTRAEVKAWALTAVHDELRRRYQGAAGSVEGP